MVFKNRDEGKKKFDGVLKQHQHLVLKGTDYLIRPFRDWKEVEIEGEELKHAIVYYAAGCYAYGDDYLFVMRKVSEPETPYISLEFSTKGKLLLAKKIHNGPVENEAEQQFIEQFRTEVLLPFIRKDSMEAKILLYKQILSVGEYRSFVHITGKPDKTLSGLKEQLDHEMDMEQDFWWCPLEDVSLMKIHAVDGILKIAVVTDGRKAILCEMPADYPNNCFLEIQEDTEK